METKQSYANDKFIMELAQSLANCQCLLNGIVMNVDKLRTDEDMINILTSMSAKNDGIRLMMFNAFDVFMKSYIMYDSYIGDQDPNKFFEVCEFVNRLRAHLGLFK